MIGVSMAILFGTTLTILSHKTVQAGHIYAVITYLWGFAMSLDNIPRLVEKFSELKDIGKRIWFKKLEQAVGFTLIFTTAKC